MVSKKLLKAAEHLHLTHVEKLPLEDSYLYGGCEGYLVSLYDDGKGKTFFINYYADGFDDDEESIRSVEISEELKSIVREQVLLDYSVLPQGLSCTLSGTWEDTISCMKNVCRMLADEDLDGAVRCSCCGNKIGKRPPKRVVVGKDNYLYCDHCALEVLETQKEQPANTADQPSHGLRGLLGACIGGLIGAFVYFALYKWIYPLLSGSSFDFRYIFTACGLLTAFLVYKGYTVLSKKPCAAEAVTVSVLSVLFTSAGQYLGCFAWYAEKQGFGFFDAMRIPSMWLIHLRSTVDASLTYDQTVLDNYNIAPVFYRLLLISLLFAVIGTILS